MSGDTDIIIITQDANKQNRTVLYSSVICFHFPSKADSYGNVKLIRKWTKSVFFIRDQKFGQSQTYGNGFVSA